jgi:hypothetical protein
VHQLQKVQWMQVDLTNLINTNKRIDATDKKNRALNEQLVTVRKHINQRIRQDKKDSE